MAQPKTFVRDATGLVRQIGFFDHTITNMNGVGIISALFSTAWFVWFAVPQGDILITILVGYLFGVFGSILAVAIISATFPRSAAPYVATSRVLHPAIGWPAEFLEWIGWSLGIATMGGVVVTLALVPGLYTMGISSGNQALVNAAFAVSAPVWSFIVGTIALVVSFIAAVSGTRRLVRTFQLPITILMILSTIIIIIYWAQATPATLQSALPKYLNANYDDIVNGAKSQFPAAMAPISYNLFTFMGSLGFGVGAFNSYWNAWAVGEVKRGNEFKRQYLSMLIPSTFLVVLVGLAVGVAQFTAGRDFLVALTNMLTINPGFFKNVPASFIGGVGALLFVPMILADNFWVQFLLMVGMISAGVIFMPVAWLIISRQWFAWSFDRIVPAKFASVNERFHTPVFNLTANLVFLEILMAAIVFAPSYFGFFLAAGWAFSVLPVGIYMLVVILLPFRKEIWALSPVKKYKLGAIIAVVAGIVGLVFQADGTYFLAATPALGFGLPSSEILAVLFVIPFVAYWIIRQIRLKQGIDIDLIFKTVPPE